MNKAYERINWENYPSENTALNEANLNKMDAALNEVDTRVVAHETTKLDKATANSMVKDVDFDETTGIFTITFLNGVTKTLDTKLEKIATNFRYDYETQKLILTLVDGTTQEIDMSALLTQYEFENSAYINWTVVNGKVKAEIVNGSITADKLQPNFLADVTLQANSAKTSEQNAKTSEENAKQSELNAKNYADSAEPVASAKIGLNPTLDNSTSAPIISFKGDGATEQQTYSGKNLVYETFEKLAIGADGTLVSNESHSMHVAKVESGKTYTITTDDANGAVCGYYVDEPAESSVTYDATRHITSSKTITIPSGVSYVAFRSNYGYATPQLEEGAEATPYEPYVGGTASPNPDYPQEIHGVGESGVLEVKSTGKNFINATLKTTTVNGVTCTNNGDGTYTLNGTATGTDNWQLSLTGTVDIELEVGKKYKVIGMPTGTTGHLGVKADRNECYEADSSIASNLDGTFTCFKNERVYIKFNAGEVFNNFVFKPMITDDLTATYDDYKPYTETTADIPLSAPLYEGDYIRYNMDGSGEESRKMKSVVFDGSESGWAFASNQARIALTAKNYIGMCSHFIKQTTEGWANLDYNQFNIIEGEIRFKPNIEGVTDLATWKTWLAENKPKVVYELAEPTVTPLTAEQIAEFEKLRTFDGTTHVTCEAESEIQYFCDSVGGRAVVSVAKKLQNEIEKAVEDSEDTSNSANITVVQLLEQPEGADVGAIICTEVNKRVAMYFSETYMDASEYSHTILKGHALCRVPIEYAPYNYGKNFIGVHALVNYVLNAETPEEENIIIPIWVDSIGLVTYSGNEEISALGCLRGQIFWDIE